MALAAANRRHGHRQHWWPVALVLVLGAAVRGLALAASGPDSLYLNDSVDYLARAKDLRPVGYHPLGYAVFLRLVHGGSHPLVLSVLQHLIGLATGVLVVAAARRLGLGPWACAFAAAPQLLDPYVAVTEQFVVAETVFTFLLVAAVLTAVAGRYVPAGLLFAAATLTRTVALPVAVLALIAVLVRLGWRRALPAALAVVLPLAAYAGFYADTHGRPGLEEHSGIYLYGRLASFVPCPEKGADPRLCDSRPVADRPQPDWYIWSPEAPLKNLGLSVDARSDLATTAGKAYAEHHPLLWLTTTVGYLAHYVSPVRDVRRQDSGLTTWLVSDRTSTALPASDPRLADGTRVTRTVRPGPTRVLRDLQETVWTPAWLYVLLALAGFLGVGRGSGTAVRRVWALAFAGAFVLLLVPAATVGWDVRYLLPALPLLGLAAVTGPALARL